MNKNVLGSELETCCTKPLTGYFRDGLCRTDQTDQGSHVICARVTDKFLAFSKAGGNDLSTPHPEYRFDGLQHGDCWCLCALRWQEALEAGVAPPVLLGSTNIKALEFVTLADLKRHALEMN